MGSTVNSTNFVSIKRAWARAWSTTGWQDEVSELTLLDWSAEIIGLIGMGTEYFKREIYVGEVKDYKGHLPKCIDDLVAVAGYPNGKLNSCREDYYPRENFEGMRSSTDSFHHYQRHLPDCNNCDLTYTINDNCLFTSFCEGLFMVAYNKIPVDNEGYPLIVERETLITAIAAHLNWRIASLKFVKGEIDRGVLQMLEQERLFYVGKAQVKSFNGDKAQTVGNIWSRMIPKNTTHRFGHITLGSREERYTNNVAGLSNYRPSLDANKGLVLSGYFYEVGNI